MQLAQQATNGGRAPAVKNSVTSVRRVA